MGSRRSSWNQCRFTEKVLKAPIFPKCGRNPLMNIDPRRHEVTHGNTSIGRSRWSPAMTTPNRDLAPHQCSTAAVGGSEPLWLTVSAAARRWRVCERTVERLLLRHPDATLRVGRSLRVDVRAIERALRGGR